MANTYGITPGFATVILSTLNNGSPRADIVCAALHVGNPGAAGLANPSAMTERQQLTFTAPADGAVDLTGGQPAWEMTDSETLTAVSLWSGLDGDESAVCMFTLAASPVQVYNGDLVILNTCHLEWWAAAQGLWNPVGTIESPPAQATASASAPSISAGPAFVTITAPPATASAQASAPTLLVLTAIAAPPATASAQASAPVVSGSAAISAPAAQASAAAPAPSVTVVATPPVAQRQIRVAVMRAATR